MGCPVFAAAKNLGKSSVPIAEASALRDGLLQAMELGFNRVCAEGDSTLIINAVSPYS